MVSGINEVTQRFGGKFEVGYNPSWRHIIYDFKKRKFAIIHLTAYGVPLQKKIAQIKRKKNILVIVGSEKVPGEVYQMSNFNISITQQPHSEVASLAIFLHEYFKGKELNKMFRNAKIEIVPQEHGKKVVEK
jgi:tRNA (cytidine56-2'-O)-methyltransferase